MTEVAASPATAASSNLATLAIGYTDMTVFAADVVNSLRQTVGLASLRAAVHEKRRTGPVSDRAAFAIAQLADLREIAGRGPVRHALASHWRCAR